MGRPCDPKAGHRDSRGGTFQVCYALQLAPRERAELVEALSASLDGSDLGDAGETEIRQRIADVDEGRVMPVPGSKSSRASSNACVPASTFRCVPAAGRELDEAAFLYEERREGLGLEFLTVVRENVFALMDAPDRWRVVNGTRRALLEGFPYAVVYREVSESEIVAGAHLRRTPKYWANR